MSVLEQRLTFTENKLKEVPNNTHYQSGNGQTNISSSRIESTKSSNTQNGIKALSNSK